MIAAASAVLENATKGNMLVWPFAPVRNNSHVANS